MFKDERRDKVWSELRQLELRAFAKQLTPEVFAGAARKAGVRIGCSALNKLNMVWLGIATAMHYTASFAIVLTMTMKLLEDQEEFRRGSLGKEKENAKRREKNRKRGKRSKHHPQRNDPTEVTEEAFAQARQRMPLKFWIALLTILAGNFQRDHSQHLKFKSFRLVALDGTTIPLAKVDALINHYGRPKNGSRKKAAPQARMVMMTLPGVRIPIAYEVAPLSNSELALAGRLMPHVQPNDLVLMDRGFTSYGLFWQIQKDRQAFFGTRLKKNMKYKVVRRLGDKDLLIEWTPKNTRGLWTHLPRSIRLRVIRYQFRGFRASAILTNVLDPKRLSREDWVRVASDCDDNGRFIPGLYHRRWEIETSFRELKVVLNLKSLRSHTPASLEYELAGRVVYYLLVHWLMVLAAEKHGLDPLRISFTNALCELEEMRSTIVTSSQNHVSRVLLPRLLDRIASHTVPLRPGRHYPRPNDTKVKNCGRGRKKQLPAKLTNRVNSNYKSAMRKKQKQA